jgi:hypothetical protein
MRARNLVCTALLTAAVSLAAGAAALAEMRVIESNSPRYAVGMRLPDDAKLKLKKGERVRVLLSSNRTKLFTGGGSKSGTTGGTRSVVKD